MNPSLSPAVTVEGIPELAALLTVSAFLAFFLYVMRSQTGSASQRRRMNAFVKQAAGGPAQEEQRTFSERVVVPVLQQLASPILRLTPQTVLSQAREDLAHAGDPWHLGPAEFVGIRVALAVAAVVGAVLADAAGLIPAEVRAYAPVVFGVFGYYFPGLVLQRAIKGRQRVIRRVLSQTLEVLSVSIEAGLAFDGAIAHVAQRFNNPLSDELRRMFLEFQMGRSRRQALGDFAKRIGMPEIDRFAASILQAEAMGAPLSKVLQDQAAELRTLMRQRAEESARTAPIKMMIPLVTLILPALFIVILGPTVANLVGGVSF